MPKPSIPQASLITDKSNIRYLSNFTGSSGFMLLTKNKNYLFTDFRYIERAKNTINKGIEIVDTTRVWRNPQMLKENWQKVLNKHKISNLGVEEANLTVTQFKKFKTISSKIKFVDISGNIEKKREIKSEKEIKLIEESQRINEKVFIEIKKIAQAKNGITELELAWKIKELGYQYGADEVSFDPIVGFGPNSAIVHHSPTTKKLKKGEIILIDMGMKYQGYCSDMTRMIFTKKPSPKQTEIYNLVLESQLASIKVIKEGITGQEADGTGRQIINNAGYKDQYGHSGGHGIGLDIHESPSLSENCTAKFKANTIVTVEPGIYLPGEFGVRIEDMVLVQKSGCKGLTKIEKGLQLF